MEDELTNGGSIGKKKILRLFAMLRFVRNEYGKKKSKCTEAGESEN